MKKSPAIAAALIFTAVIFITAGCSKKNEGQIKIGIIQLVEHPALDAAYKGFTDGLEEAGFKNGENIIIDYHNAQGEQINCVTIAEKLVNDRDDLILAIATSAAQAVANLTKTIPILVTAVTDPESANLVKSNSMPETNISGTSDLTPISAQISLLKKIVPDAKKIGLIYCSSEQNSYFQIQIAKEECEKLGLEFIEGAVANYNDIQLVTQTLCGKTDAIYAPTDNMIATGMATIAEIAKENKIPIIAGAGTMVESGALAAYGIDYYELGKQTAKMAQDILNNGKNPSEMPIQYQEKYELKINKETAQAIGITIPENP